MNESIEIYLINPIEAANSLTSNDKKRFFKLIMKCIGEILSSYLFQLILSLNMDNGEGSGVWNCFKVLQRQFIRNNSF